MSGKGMTIGEALQSINQIMKIYNKKREFYFCLKCKRNHYVDSKIGEEHIKNKMV